MYRQTYGQGNFQPSHGMNSGYNPGYSSSFPQDDDPSRKSSPDPLLTVNRYVDKIRVSCSNPETSEEDRGNL